jgi:hypothetical protein
VHDAGATAGHVGDLGIDLLDRVGSPPTIASLSGLAAAAVLRAPPTVVSSTGEDVSAGQYELVSSGIAAS